ncbi:MAG: hypothetical protein ACRDPB_00265, partial [Nocardioidaceae bacterium]
GPGIAEAVGSHAVVGGGGAPGVELDSAAVALPAELAEPLRRGASPVVGHVEAGRLLLDLIAVPAEQDEAIADAVRSVVEARRLAVSDGDGGSLRG